MPGQVEEAGTGGGVEEEEAEEDSDEGEERQHHRNMKSMFIDVIYNSHFFVL